MALSDHNRLDKKLNVEQYTDALCGSYNIQTGQAEYCGFDCPTLKKRMMNNEDAGRALNKWPPDPVILPDR